MGTFKSVRQDVRRFHFLGARYQDWVQVGAKQGYVSPGILSEHLENRRWHQFQPRRWSERGCGAARRYRAGDGRLSSPTLS